jgi:hypothetical protein
MFSPKAPDLGRLCDNLGVTAMVRGATEEFIGIAARQLTSAAAGELERRLAAHGRDTRHSGRPASGHPHSRRPRAPERDRYPRADRDRAPADRDRAPADSDELGELRTAIAGLARRIDSLHARDGDDGSRLRR